MFKFQFNPVDTYWSCYEGGTEPNIITASIVAFFKINAHVSVNDKYGQEYTGFVRYNTDYIKSVLVARFEYIELYSCPNIIGVNELFIQKDQPFNYLVQKAESFNTLGA